MRDRHAIDAFRAVSCHAWLSGHALALDAGGRTHEVVRMTYRALIVEDEPSIRRLVASVLIDDGWATAEASNGVEALSQVDAQHFDAIVLDLDMPVMDGRSFYRAMLERGDPVPTVILSAYGARAAAIELGAPYAMSKPFDLDDFSRMMARLLQDSHADAT
jgi:CheY-like chemotaxis protein